MTGATIVFDPATFSEGRNELADLRTSIAQALAELQHEASYKLAMIKRRGEQLQVQLDDARWNVDNLDDEDSGDWEYEELERAQRELADFHRLSAQADSVMKRLNSELRRYSELATGQIVASVAEADRVLGDAAAYLSIELDNLPSSRSGAKVAGSGTSPPSPKQHTYSASSGLDSLRASCSSDGLPDGYYWLELSDLPENCFVNDPGEFKKLDKEAMKAGTRTLFEHVLPELARNPMANSVTFEEIDRREGTGYFDDGSVRPESRAAVYEAFLSKRSTADVVIVGNVHPNGAIDMLSGRHRLGVARELGYTRIPARIGTGPLQKS